MQQPTQEGPRAAWGYLRLAVHALVHPMLAQLPPMANQMRAYLVLCLMLYGYAALAFLFQIPGITAGRTGLDLLDAPAWHAAWGLAFACVGLSQLGALFIGRWPVRRIAAALTASLASGYWFVTLALALHYHSFAGIMVWGFITGIHIIFVWSYLVPVQRARMTSLEEQQLIAKLYGLIHQERVEHDAFVRTRAPRLAPQW